MGLRLINQNICKVFENMCVREEVHSFEIKRINVSDLKFRLSKALQQFNFFFFFSIFFFFFFDFFFFFSLSYKKKYIR